MDFTDAVSRRRMVRSFSGRPLAPEVLDRILATALRAPSAGNTGGWDLIVLQGPGQTALFWETTTDADWQATYRRWPGLAKAPVVVLLYAHPRAYLDRYSEADKETAGLGSTEGAWTIPYWFVDTGFAALLLLLSAVDAGVGACFLGNFRGEEALATALGVPSDRRYLGAVLVGEPGGDDPPSPSLARGPRRAEDVIHRNRW
jgi:nitroreductase